MNEPFLLSNLIELQEIDNKIYKIENEKKNSESVVRLMSLESDFKELTEKITIQKNEIQNYYKEKDTISSSRTSISQKIVDIKTKLEDKSLDSNDLLNYTKQKESNESQLSQLDTKLNILNRNNQDELDEIKKLTESLDDVKSYLIDISKLVKNEWQMIDEKLSVFESEKKELISSFPQKVQELYDDLKSRGVDVIAAYRLENNQCGCCGVDLTSSELDSIFDTEFQQCPYCGGILV